MRFGGEGGAAAGLGGAGAVKYNRLSLRQDQIFEQ